MEWGTTFGRVPLESLEHHLWLYESGYYQSLIEKANLTNPTELTSSGENIRLQFACIYRTLHPCILLEQFLAPNLNARTNGQLTLEVTSFPELGLAGPTPWHGYATALCLRLPSMAATWPASCPKSRF